MVVTHPIRNTSRVTLVTKIQVTLTAAFLRTPGGQQLKTLTQLICETSYGTMLSFANYQIPGTSAPMPIRNIQNSVTNEAKSLAQPLKS